MLRRTRNSANIFRFIGLSCAAILALALAGRAMATGLTYVDAVPEDPFFPDPNTQNLGPGLAIAAGSTGTDNLWALRKNFGSGGLPSADPNPAFGVVESSAGAEDSPELKMTVQGTPGLVIGNQYDVYVAYWTDSDENWTLRAGRTSGNLTLFDYSDSVLRDPPVGAIPGIRASAAIYEPLGLPAPTAEGTRFTQRPADPLFMLLAKVPGTVTAVNNGSGVAKIEVFVDDLPFAVSEDPGNRTWFDGMAYVAANTPIAVTASIDRSSGEMILSNPTNNPLQIKSYSITSAGGALNSMDWNTIDGNLDNGGGFDSDNWSITAPVTPPGGTAFETTLSEAETPAGNGGSLSAGNPLNLGTIWQRSPLQDVTVNLTLADDSIMTIGASYTGDPIEQGDLDADGDIDVADFQTLLNNIHTDVSASARVDARQRGDLTGNRVINFADYRAFRAAYEAAPGSGSFADLLAQVNGQVPEPSSLALLVIAAAFVFGGSRRRVAGFALALLVCCLLTSTASAVPLVAVDVNDRNSTDGSDTAPGFSPFLLPLFDTPPGNGVFDPVSTAVVTVDGYTFDLSVFDSNGATGGVGSMDDRDRVVPTTAPTLNEVYDDFLFVGGSAGATGGLDMKISGGALVPNTAYTVSIYAYDGIDATMASGTQNRVADWFDGNSADAPVLSTNFTINQPPTTDDQYKFSGLAYTDNAGQLFLKGRRVTAADVAVYVDAVAIDIPVELTLEVDKGTGEVRILNEQSVSFDMSYYEIRSSSGALNPSGWVSLDDAEGTPPADPIGNGWDEATSSTANLLSEVRLEGLTTFDPTDEMPLGSPFAIGGAQDVRFFYAGPNDATLQGGIVKFVGVAPGLAGDYNNDGTVDAADYVVWRRSIGTQAAYNVWRANFGMSLPGAGGEEAAATPEPTSVALLMLGVFGCYLARRRAYTHPSLN